MEEKFVLLCERDSLTPPDVNVKVAGWMVDAVWFDQRIAVELDSHVAHGTPAAMEEDRRRDLELRAAGYIVLRYTWRQLTDEWDLVIADLRRHGVGDSEPIIWWPFPKRLAGSGGLRHRHAASSDAHDMTCR